MCFGNVVDAVVRAKMCISCDAAVNKTALCFSTQQIVVDEWLKRWFLVSFIVNCYCSFLRIFCVSRVHVEQFQVDFFLVKTKNNENFRVLWTVSEQKSVYCARSRNSNTNYCNCCFMLYSFFILAHIYFGKIYGRKLPRLHGAIYLGAAFLSPSIFFHTPRFVCVFAVSVFQWMKYLNFITYKTDRRLFGRTVFCHIYSHFGRALCDWLQYELM